MTVIEINAYTWVHNGYSMNIFNLVNLLAKSIVAISFGVHLFLGLTGATLIATLCVKIFEWIYSFKSSEHVSKPVIRGIQSDIKMKICANPQEDEFDAASDESSLDLNSKVIT